MGKLERAISIIDDENRKDPNFEFYRNSAKNFGFFVDKNAPWRLVANLRSPKIAYISLKNVFFFLEKRRFFAL